VPPRVLIITASVGEGHDLPARTLAAQLHGIDPHVEAVIEDGLVAMDGLVRRLSDDMPRVIFFKAQVAWDALFWLSTSFPPTRRLAKWILMRSGAPGLLRLIERVQPDVVVSTFPHSTEVLGTLRRTGRLSVPAVAVVTDVAALHFWASPGIDLHLVTQPEAIAEVRRVAGAETGVQCVTGLTDVRFERLRDPAAARAALALPADGRVVLVSGGGWGVGDVVGAVETALTLTDVAQVVCLCGHSEPLRREMTHRFGSVPRIRVEGFTDRMPDWLAAADAIVHSTGGLTVFEALLSGCRPISYGWGRGHVRRHNAAFARYGLAQVVTSRRDLADALRRALDAERRPDRSYAGRPSAAAAVMDLVGRDRRATIATAPQ
jgi:UDP-N-acetylglucosamine:LPS N-acetylglucosamine transferase